MAGGGWAVFDPVADAAALARAATGRAVIVCLAGVTPARAAAGADMADNSALAQAAIRAGAACGARVLLASSAAVYGATPGLLAEGTALAPVSEYGRAKARMEDTAADLGARLGVQVTSLRIGNIAGLDAALGGWTPGFRLHRFADGGTPARSYVGPRTLARVLADLAAAPVLPPVLNVAAPGTVEMGALLDAAGRAWTPEPAPQTAIRRVHLDVRALAPFTALDRHASLPRTLVDEWRETERMTR
jgi:nucleoside-diphosphate-sugar epimerase